MTGGLCRWPLWSGLVSLCLLSACANLGPTGGHRSEFTAGTIDSLSPASIMAGAPSFTLTVNGSNLNQGFVTLVWNGTTEIQPLQGSNTQVSFFIDGSLIATAGSASIQLIDAVPGDRPSNTVTFTITPPGPTACFLFGAYEFLYSGFDGNAIAGVFTVDANGGINGEEDFVDNLGTVAFPIAGNCKNSSTPNQGTVTITSSGQPASTYTFVLQQSSGGPARGRLAGNGNVSPGTLSGSGVFVGTATDAVFKDGDYIFGLLGEDPYGNSGVGSQTAAAGRFTYSNETLSAGVADISDGGTVMASASVTGSKAPLSPDVWPRIQLNLTIAGLKTMLIFYPSSSGSAFAIGTIATPFPHSSGLGVANVVAFVSPQANAGTYSNSSLNAPLVFTTWGAPPPLCCPTTTPSFTDTTIGLASGFNGNAGSFNLLLDNVSGGVANLNQAIAGATYNVAGNGRAMVSYTLGGNTLNYVYYLDNPNDGFILGQSGDSAEFGFFQPQAPGPFTTASVNGTFASATFLPLVPASPNLATEITLNNGALTANTPAGALTGSYTVDASGRGTATVNLPVLGTNDLVLYVIGPQSIILMGSDNTAADAITFMHF